MNIFRQSLKNSKIPLMSAGKSTSLIHRARQEAIERLAEVR